MSTVLEPPARPVPPPPQPSLNYLNVRFGVRSWLLTVDHKRIAILYLITITLMFFVGGAFAVLIRLELFSNRVFVASAVVTVIGMFAYLGTAYGTSIRLSAIQGYSPLKTSIAFGSWLAGNVQCASLLGVAHSPNWKSCGVGWNCRAWSPSVLKPSWPCSTTEKPQPGPGWPRLALLTLNVM